jgi:hypothetical protein
VVSSHIGFWKNLRNVKAKKKKIIPSNLEVKTLGITQPNLHSSLVAGFTYWYSRYFKTTHFPRVIARHEQEKVVLHQTEITFFTQISLKGRRW